VLAPEPVWGKLCNEAAIQTDAGIIKNKEEKSTNNMLFSS